MIREKIRRKIAAWQDGQEWRQQILEKNRRAVQQMNREMFRGIFMTMQALLLFLLLLGLVSDFVRPMQPVYAVWYIACLAVYLIFRRQTLSLPGLYVFWGVMLVGCIYLSSAIWPLWPATVTVGCLVLIPITILDEPWRVVIFTAAGYLVCVVFDILFKSSELLIMNMVVCGCFTAGGLVLGYYFQWVRLKNAELRFRQRRRKEETESVKPAFGGDLQDTLEEPAVSE